MEVAPFFVDFHHFLSILTIFYRFSRFTHFCCDLHFVAIYALFPQFFFGQNSHHRIITRFFAFMQLTINLLLHRFSSMWCFIFFGTLIGVSGQFSYLQGHRYGRFFCFRKLWESTWRRFGLVIMRKHFTNKSVTPLFPGKKLGSLESKGNEWGPSH